jgi:peptidoglycan/xylan/chitin deacetylase (PgdA/CDA1 family)
VLVAGLVVAVIVVAGDRSPDVAERPTSTTVTVTSTTVPMTAPTTAPTTAPPAPTTAPTTTPPPATTPAIVVRQGDTTRPVVAITIDAGSDTGHATEMLDTLAAYGVRATFGMTGRWAEANPGLVRRMAVEGHQLVNHSYDHPSFTGRSTGTAPLTTAQRLDQLARADAAIRAAGGGTTKPWFRPPYGDVDDSVLADVGSAGYRYALMWTVDSLGWKGDGADQIVARCLDRAAPGAIYLFHVGSASADHAALPRIIDGLRQRGYSFATAATVTAAF